jgi:hypothetical protein
VIILDLNQVMISNLMVTLGSHLSNSVIEESLIRHFILNSVKGYNKKFGSKYGEMIIACDDTNNWRKQLFPYYKANRKKSREESDLDWNQVFVILNKIREELKEYFPYRVIQINHAEADDVIASLAHAFGNTHEKILIVSGDKDFKQLQAYMNVEQFDPIKKKFIKENNPTAFLKEQIMRGDQSDGVPNFLSKDESFVLKIRQKPISQKKLDGWIYMQPEEFCDELMLRGYRRNEQLIDLSLIPETIKLETMNQYVQQEGKGRDKLFNYFVEHKLKNLMAEITDF